MTNLYNTKPPCVLTRIWLPTTSRTAPLRSVWITTRPSNTASANNQIGGPLCA